VNSSNTPRPINHREILLKLFNRLNLVSKYKHLLPGSYEKIIKSINEPMQFVDFFIKYQYCLAYVFIGHVLLSDDYFDRVTQDVSAQFLNARLESG
jgi:hypothetical protein